MRESSVAMLVLSLTLACSDGPLRPAEHVPAERGFELPPRPLALVSPPAASVSVQVQVPTGLRSAPFDVPRFLSVPPGFSIAVYARIAGARFMTVAPNGDLLVSQPSSGSVLLVRPSGTGTPSVSTFVTGLRRPHDLVFYTIGATTYLYVAETHQINRYIYTPGDLTGRSRQIVVIGLPDASLPELGGSYGHELKNIALGPVDKLYVSIGSSCNACASDTQANPVRASVYQYGADGAGGRLFARGLRNAEGLAFVPGTSDLWVAVNNRDQIPYPLNDGSGNYGKVLPFYVDDHPPEELTRVRDGGNYGWPFCNPNPNSATGVDNMPFDRDYETNADGRVACSAMDRINKGIQAHSAPLGLTFFQGTAVPSAYRSGAAVALHGSWNRTTKTGYKVIYFPWDDASQLPGAQIDLVAGWLVGEDNWGRPVDVAVDQQGSIFISDDYSGTVYKLFPATSPPPTDQPPTARFTYSCSGLTCTLDGRSSTDDAGIASYAWSLGMSPNGSASGPVVTATYPHDGPRTVTLTVTDAGGQTNSVTQTIQVGGTTPPPADARPVAQFTYSCSGLTCTLDGRASTDDKGIVSYAWDLGKLPDRYASGAVVSATYPHEGSRTVVLTVTDGIGQTNSVTKTIQVGGAAPPPTPPADQPPVARFTVSCAQLSCRLDASTSSDDKGIVTYSWSLGKYPDGSASGVVVTTTYPHSGTRTVTLTVTDAAGQTASSTQTFGVQ